MEFDGVIVGGGGAGMRASLQLAQSGLKTAVISKVFPTRSHTVSAQGGITCAIASVNRAPFDLAEEHSGLTHPPTPEEEVRATFCGT